MWAQKKSPGCPLSTSIKVYRVISWFNFELLQLLTILEYRNHFPVQVGPCIGRILPIRSIPRYMGYYTIYCYILQYIAIYCKNVSKVIYCHFYNFRKAVIIQRTHHNIHQIWVKENCYFLCNQNIINTFVQ